MNRTLVLDMDGTLVDSVPDLAASLNAVMDARGLGRFTPAETARMVGDGARKLVERAFAARGRSAGEDDLADFLAEYGGRVAVESRLYPEADTTLRHLRDAGWRVAICTNKPEKLARDLLEAFGLAAMVAAVGGGDSFAARKPDPAHLLATVAAAGGEPGAAVMTGDHHNDVLAAIGAGMPCVFAAWGYGTPDMARGAAAVAQRFADLPALVSRLLPLRAEAGERQELPSRPR